VSPTRKVPPPGSARLFADSHAPGPPAGVYVANIDGASRGNPGPASYAVVLRDPEGKIALELAKNIGRETNNVAEYFALLAALDYAASHNIAALRVRSDSELDALANVALDSAGVPKFEDGKSRIAEGIPPATARDNRSSAPAPARARANPSRTIRARFLRGVFVPADSVDLPEGSEVTLDLHMPLKQ
jgi:hypothetical protein